MATKEDEIEFHCLEEEKTSQINMCSGSDWDDSVLIHAYDKAMNKVKAEVARKNNIALNGPMNEHKGKTRVQKSKKKAKNVEEWKVGEYCQAQYSGDGVTYEAVIIDINESEAACLIRYIGYENEEEIAIDSLLPSEGRFARMAQEKMARSEMQSTAHDDESVSYSEEGSERSRCDRRSDRSYQYILNRDKASESLPRYSCCSPSHAPPPSAVPPPFLFDREGNEDDKLYSMLLSWYMSGYHTGFYLGSRQANRRQSSCDCNYQCH